MTPQMSANIQYTHVLVQNEVDNQLKIEQNITLLQTQIQ